MIVQKISLNNWKNFRDKIEVDLSPGLNILHGPNESGKSALIDAIRMVFFTKHKTKKGKIEDVVPWDSLLNPYAKISFIANNESYRITKQYMSPKSILEKYYQDNWNKIADGDLADKELVNILGGKLPHSGDTKPESWGIGQCLWMEQGTPSISGKVNQETLSSLSGLIGAAIETDEETKILTDIKKEFDSNYTASQRKPKSGSELLKVEQELAELNEEIVKAEAQKVKKEEIIRDIEDKEVFLRKKETELGNTLQRKSDLKAEVHAAQEHREERQELEMEIKNLNTQYDLLKTQIDDINENKSIIEKLVERKKLLELEENPLQETFNSNEETLESIKKNISALEENIEIKNEEFRIARIAQATLKREQELEEKLSRLKVVKELSKEIANKKDESDSLNSPSIDELESIEGLADQIIDKETRLDAIGLTIDANIMPGVSGKIVLDSSDELLNIENSNSSWKAHQSVKLIFKDIGDFSIKSGSQDVKKMQEDLEALKIDYQELTAPFDVDLPRKLRDLYNKKISLQKSLEYLNKELSNQAKEGKEELEKDISRLETRIELNWAKISPESRIINLNNNNERSKAIDSLTQTIDNKEEEIEDIKSKRKILISKQETKMAYKEELQSQISTLNQDIRGNQERLEQIEDQLKKQESDGLTIDQKEKNLNQLSQDIEKKERALSVYKEQMDEKENQPISEYKFIKNKLEKLQEDINQLKIDHSNLKKDLEIILNSSNDLNKLEEQLENQEKYYKEIETRAKAIEILYDLSNHYRESTIEALSEPVSKIFSKDLERLLGPKYSFKLGKGIKPDQVDVIGTNEETKLQNLSFGTQEQIWFLFRLSLGRLLSDKERQLVILDDPLVNTDEARLQRALRILQESAKDVQLIVVTCEIDKYSALDANFIGLEKGVLVENERSL